GIMPGTLVALVAGLDATMLPSVDRLKLSAFSCTPAGCAPQEVSQLADLDGSSTSALTVVLQKAINATIVVVDVAEDDGSVKLSSLTRALELASTLPTTVVLSLLPPDAGFAYAPAAATAFDPYGRVSGSADDRGHGHGHDHHMAMETLWMAMASHLARYDLGGEDHEYPPPNGFNDSAPLHFGSGSADAHGHGEHGGAYGAHADAGTYGPGTGPDACHPFPPTGPRLGRLGSLFPAIQGYERFVDGIKLPQGITAGDLSILPRVEAAAFEEHSHHLLEMACLEIALSELAHHGVPVVVPAGDHAEHRNALDPPRATWDLQTVEDLAALPMVITVGATTSAEIAAPPLYGTRRIVAPNSAVGPAPSLYGIKPDLVAPGDIPVPLVGSMAYAGSSTPQRFDLAERFAHNETRGWVLSAPGVEVRDDRLRIVPPADAARRSGIQFNGSRVVPPGHFVNATLDFDALAVPSGNRVVLALRNDSALDGVDGRDGFGVEFRAIDGGSIQARTRVWKADGAEFFPVCVPTCGGAGTTATFNAGSKIAVRIQDVGATPTGNRLLRFSFEPDGGQVPQTLFREAKPDGAQRACLCQRLTLLSEGTTGKTLNLTADDVEARGLVTAANTDYAPGVPMVGEAIVRPTTRVAAAYVAAVALIESFLAGEGEGVHRLEHVRGRLASLAARMPDTPVLAQGAGELNLENQASRDTAVALFEHVPHAPGVDLGLLKGPGASAEVTFASPRFSEAIWDQATVKFDLARAKWTRAEHSGAVVALGDGEVPTFEPTSVVEGQNRTV
ncbi:MAG TPA: hypothetical protein VHH36_07235, partial [Candidatus Thermoplasmatota archaeon]|nr:hypothetical protein [Candidatus Thermoplasmatota archaeon]